MAGGTTWLGRVAGAAVATVGQGCGTTPPVLGVVGDPVPGDSCTAELHRLAAAPFLLGFGVGTTTLPIGGGCLRLPQLDLVWLGLPGVGGHFALPMPVPDDPSLSGLETTTQAAQLDPAAATGLALNSLRLQAGP